MLSKTSTVITWLLIYIAITAFGYIVSSLTALSILSILLAQLILLCIALFIFTSRKLAQPAQEIGDEPTLVQSRSIEAIQDCIDIGLWQISSSQGTIVFSEASAKILNLSKDDLTISIHDFIMMVYKSDRKQAIKALRGGIENQYDINIEIRFSGNHSYLQWVVIKGRTYLDERNQQQIILGMIQDITNQVLINLVQREMKELLTDILEHQEATHTLIHICQAMNDIEPSIQCVFFLNSLTSDKPQILGANSLPSDLKSILKSTTIIDDNSELEQTYHKRHPLYIPDLYKLKAWSSVQQVETEERYKSFLGQAIFSNDHKVQGAICLYLKDDELPVKVLEQVLSVLYKIATVAIEDQLQTDTKEKIQQQLYHSQKMDSIGHLTGGIAHDFNNILGSIVGYNSLAIKVANKIEHDKLKGYVNEVGVAADRARELISQMMAFSRSEPTRPLTIDANIVIKEVLQLIRSMIPTSIEIIPTISKNCPKIQINPISLHQVLLNHLVNAKDAIIDEVGSIKINMFPVFDVNMDCISCHDHFNGSYVAIEITDDGCGIPSEVVRKVFDPFFTTKEIGRGTGMGLSVVHGILHDVGAHITVNSQPDKGTTFTIYFPEVVEDDDESLTESLVADRQANAGSGQHLIVVDDDIPLLLLFEEILRSNGYETSRFERAADALEAFKAEPNKYDLILTDQTMPNMTGDEMAKEMLNIKPELPIIVCTGFSNKLTPEMADEIGIKIMLKKPVDIHELLDHINALMKENN